MENMQLGMLVFMAILSISFVVVLSPPTEMQLQQQQHAMDLTTIN